MRLRGLRGILLAFLIEGSIKAQFAIAFTNVAVVDVEKGALRLEQTVVIEGSRITAAGDAQRIHPPRGARIIDGQSKFLMPGLWDMHVHAMPLPHIPELFIANGMTGIRDMYDDPPKIRDLGVSVVLERKITLRCNDLFYVGVATSTRLTFPLRTVFSSPWFRRDPTDG